MMRATAVAKPAKAEATVEAEFGAVGGLIHFVSAHVKTTPPASPPATVAAAASAGWADTPARTAPKNVAHFVSATQAVYSVSHFSAVQVAISARAAAVASAMALAVASAAALASISAWVMTAGLDPDGVPEPETEPEPL